ncbi:hypothetical protein [Streptomyces lydicus]|uniref:hypothetical protein n=1 Tax=Streptomyces lydicus TaxID=47763 RepID=UPI0037960F5D
MLGTAAVLTAAALAVPALTGPDDSPDGGGAPPPQTPARGTGSALITVHNVDAVCRIANGVTVTDEVGGHSRMWFRIDHEGKQMWVPGIRIRPQQLENTALPSCPE